MAGGIGKGLGAGDCDTAARRSRPNCDPIVTFAAASGHQNPTNPTAHLGRGGSFRAGGNGRKALVSVSVTPLGNVYSNVTS